MTDWADYDDFQDALGQEMAERERREYEDGVAQAQHWDEWDR